MNLCTLAQVHDFWNPLLLTPEKSLFTDTLCYFFSSRTVMWRRGFKCFFQAPLTHLKLCYCCDLSFSGWQCAKWPLMCDEFPVVQLSVIWQYLQVVFCLSGSFLPLSVLEMGKLKFRDISALNVDGTSSISACSSICGFTFCRAWLACKGWGESIFVATVILPSAAQTKTITFFDKES